MLQLVPATSFLSSPQVRCFFHKGTSTCSYIVECTKTKKAAIIDSVLDYALHSAKVSTDFADELVKEVEKEGLKVEWILETHVHADHVTASSYLKRRLPGAKTAISERITEVQRKWAEIFDWNDFDCSGSQWDLLVSPTTVIEIGELKLTALPTPGHTPACTTFVVGDSLFTGDAIFQPDFGTARCDFPGGSAEDLFSSIHSTLYSLPDNYRIFVGHDYPPSTRSVTFVTDIGAEKASNKFITTETTKQDFVTARSTRDAQLDSPNLLYPSLQFNINAGAFPKQGSAGSAKRFIKMPLTLPKYLEEEEI
jgi:glyoxylase-like metal-dependent hydrolase (beta-lactamase superfamily II)